MQRICTHCQREVSSLVQISAGNTKVLRHSLCAHCKNISDKYAISHHGFFTDLLLFKTEAFIHILFNAPWKPSWLLLTVLRLGTMAVDALDREPAYTLEGVLRGIFRQSVDAAVLLLVFFCKTAHLSKIFYLLTALSLFSLVKLPIFFSAAAPFSQQYFPAVNILNLLLLAKGASVVTKLQPAQALLLILLSKVLSSFLLGEEFHI